MATKAKPAAASTAVAVKKPSSANIVSIKEAMAALLVDQGDKVAPGGGNAIRITQDKKFILPDGTTTPGPLELVIVDFQTEHRFYEGAFNAKEMVPPNCFAIGSNPLKMFMSKNAPDPQAADGNCQTCEMNQWDSAGVGKGKACKNTRILAVLPPDADEDTPLWKLGVSPTATKAFDGFVTSVARVFQTIPVGVVVTVGFDDSVTYSKLVFSNPQPNGNIEAHFARRAEAAEMLAIEPDVSKFVSAKPVARGKVGARR